MTFVDEFLAVRALGMLALLAAEPVLSAAFLRPESRVCCWSYSRMSGSRWVFSGLACPTFCEIKSIGSPKPATDFRALTFAGLVYGLVVLICAVAVY